MRKQAKVIKVIVPQRYPEIQTINGVDYPEGSKLELTINITFGVVIGWEYNLVDTHIDWKICDEGIYQLIDDDGNILDELYEEYIPSIIPNEYSDYLNLKIDKDGFIENWKRNQEVYSFGDVK